MQAELNAFASQASADVEMYYRSINVPKVLLISITPFTSIGDNCTDI